MTLHSVEIRWIYNWNVARNLLSKNAFSLTDSSFFVLSQVKRVDSIFITKCTVTQAWISKSASAHSEYPQSICINLLICCSWCEIDVWWIINTRVRIEFIWRIPLSIEPCNSKQLNKIGDLDGKSEANIELNETLRKNHF